MKKISRLILMLTAMLISISISSFSVHALLQEEYASGPLADVIASLGDDVIIETHL